MSSSKKMTWKVTLRQLFICLSPPSPSHSVYATILIPVLIHTGKGGGLQQGRAQITKLGWKIPTWRNPRKKLAISSLWTLINTCRKVPILATLHPIWATLHRVWATLHLVRATLHPIWATLHPIWATPHSNWATLHRVWTTLHPIWSTLHRVWAKERCAPSIWAALHPLQKDYCKPGC